MRLSKEQIAQIDATLVENKVVYDDIKLELTDHIASDIEEIMSNEEVPFEVAFKEAFEKWRLQLKPTKSWWLGDKISGPKIFVEEWVKRSKKELLYSVLISISLVLIVAMAMKGYGYDFVPKMGNIYLGITLSIGFLFVLGRISMFKPNRLTTFTYLFKKRFFRFVWMMIYFSFMFYRASFFTLAPKKFSILQFSFLHFLIVFVLIQSSFSLQLLYKHFQFERKLVS